MTRAGFSAATSSMGIRTARSRSGKALPPHCGRRLEAGVEIGGKVPGEDRPVMDLEARLLSDQMGGYPRGAKLGQDQIAVFHDILQTAGRDPADQFLRPEGPLTGGAPDVDSLRVEDQDPGIPPRQGLPEAVEAHLVIGRDEDGRFLIGRSEGVEPRIDGIVHPADPPAGLDRPPAVAPVSAEETWGILPEGPSTEPVTNG